MNATPSTIIKSIMLVIGLLCSNAALQAQHLGDQLKNKLQGKTKLAEVMTIVDSMYNDLTEEQRKKGYDGLMKYKHWMRWAWNMSRHLGPEGEFVNFSKLYYDLINSRGESGMPSTRTPIEGSWTSLGPLTSKDTPAGYFGVGIGRVDRIAFDPVNANIFYVGTPNGGLWKTYTGGQSWEPLLDTFPSLGISGITVSPSNQNEIFILTGVGDNGVGSYYQNAGSAASLGVFRSLNGGETWAYTSNFPIPAGESYVGYDLAQSKNLSSGNILLAATDIGLFRTGNSGVSWQLVQAGHFYDVEFKPGSGTVVYAATKDTIYRSVDSGTTWTLCSLDVQPTLPSQRIALAVSPANPAIVYALFGTLTGLANQFSGVYFSNNEGANFIRKATSPNILATDSLGATAYIQAGYDLCIAVHPNESNRVVTGGLNIWKSTNSANSFSYLKGWHNGADSLYVHVDQHAIAYNPLNNKLYMCNDGGIWVSNNNGVTVTNITKGLALTEFYHLAQDFTESFRLSGGTQDNGVFYRNSGSTHFLKVMGGDGFDAAFVAGNPHKFYASAGDFLVRINNDSTGAFSVITPPDTLGFREIVSHPTNPNIIFCAGKNKIHKSTDQGTSWTAKVSKGSWAMAISASNPNFMYAAGSQYWWYGTGEAYKSEDEGETWQMMSNNPGFPSLQYQMISGIAIHPYNHLHVTVALAGFTPNKIFHSGTGGQTWINITYNLPNVPVLSIITTAEGIFIGTGITVYFIIHGTNQWIDIGSNIPHAAITDLNYDQNSGTLVASTLGRGVWQRNVCIDDINLTYKLTGELTYSCDDQLTSSSFIPGNAIDSINFRANGSIKMTPGFNVKTGAHLKAKIEPCDDGNIPFQGSHPESKVSMTHQPAAVSEKKPNKG